MRISDWSSDVCSSDLTMKLTIRKASNGAISAKETHRRVIGASARNPGVEPLGELIAIFDPEIGIEFERVGHVGGVARRVALELGIDTAVRFDVREARGDEACEAHLVFGTCHEAAQLLGLLLSRAVGADNPIIDRLDVMIGRATG